MQGKKNKAKNKGSKRANKEKGRDKVKKDLSRRGEKEERKIRKEKEEREQRKMGKYEVEIRNSKSAQVLYRLKKLEYSSQMSQNSRG